MGRDAASPPSGLQWGREAEIPTAGMGSQRQHDEGGRNAAASPGWGWAPSDGDGKGIVTLVGMGMGTECSDGGRKQRWGQNATMGTETRWEPGVALMGTGEQ